MNEVHLVSIVSPAAEFHGALLFVEGEEFDVDGAGGLVDGRGFPDDLPLRIESGFRHQRHFVIPVGVVVKHDVGTPDFRRRHVQTIHAAICLFAKKKIFIFLFFSV